MDRNIRVKIFGERHTGTNYLHQLLKNSTDVRLLRGKSLLSRSAAPLQFVLPEGRYQRTREALSDFDFKCTERLNLGWKHSAIDEKLLKIVSKIPNLRVVCIAKSPEAWVVSMFRRPYHYAGEGRPSIDQLLTSEWRTVKREHSAEEFLSILDMWNKKTLSYVRLAERVPTYFLKYEDLLLNFESTTQRLAEFLQVEEAVWRQVSKSTKRDGRDYDRIRDYYVGHNYLSELTHDQQNLISRQISEEALDVFGYKKIVGE